MDRRRARGSPFGAPRRPLLRSALQHTVIAPFDGLRESLSMAEVVDEAGLVRTLRQVINFGVAGAGPLPSARDGVAHYTRQSYRDDAARIDAVTTPASGSSPGSPPTSVVL